jgi:hypothetical protein
MVEPKISSNAHLASWPMTLGVPTAVGHNVRRDANDRQNWSVGPDPDAAAHGVRTLAPWAVAAAPAYIRG